MDDINDKSKSDFFSRSIAVLQFANLGFSLIVRATRRLAVSQLEIITMAFAVCGIVTYVLYFYKPKGVGTAIEVKPSSEGVLRLVNELSELRGSEVSFDDDDDAGVGKILDHMLRQRTFDSFWEVLTDDKNALAKAREARIPNDNVLISNSSNTATSPSPSWP